MCINQLLMLLVRLLINNSSDFRRVKVMWIFDFMGGSKPLTPALFKCQLYI